MNTDELVSALIQAEIRVLKIQTKLHQWASDDPHRRFGDLFNLVVDPAFLLVAWIGCGATRVPARPGWTGAPPGPSRTGKGSKTTQWHARYGGPGMMIYWHVERKSACVYSQLKTCSSSEVAAMMEGLIRHTADVDSQITANYTDTTGPRSSGSRSPTCSATGCCPG